MHFGYGVGFHSHSLFSIQNFDLSQNVIIFRVDMSSSVHIDNRKRDILTLGEGPTQELDDTALAAEAKYSINCSKSKRKFSFVFNLLMLQKYINSQQKILK